MERRPVPAGTEVKFFRQMGLKPRRGGTLCVGHPVRIGPRLSARGSNNMEDERGICDEDAGTRQPSFRLATELRPGVTFLATVLNVY